MFDKTYVTRGGGTQVHNHSHKITENKAPTDESMRLLEEFKKEAEKSMVSRGLLKCQHTGIEIAWVKRAFTMDNPFDTTMDYRCKVNKKTLEGKIVVDPDVSDFETTEQLIEVVTKHFVSYMVFDMVKAQALKGNIRPFSSEGIVK